MYILCDAVVYPFLYALGAYLFYDDGGSVDVGALLYMVIHNMHLRTAESARIEKRPCHSAANESSKRRACTNHYRYSTSLRYVQCIFKVQYIVEAHYIVNVQYLNKVQYMV